MCLSTILIYFEIIITHKKDLQLATILTSYRTPTHNEVRYAQFGYLTAPNRTDLHYFEITLPLELLLS